MVQAAALLACLFSFLLWPAAPAQAQEIGWGASESVLQRKYGPSLKRESCTTDRQRHVEARGRACESLYVQPYDMASVPFKLEFFLSPDERSLVQVVKSWSGSGSPEQFRLRYHALRAALRQRFGARDDHFVQTEHGITRARTRWYTHDTAVELISFSSQHVQRLYVMYLPRPSHNGGNSDAY